jgi:predicted porin
MKNTLLCTTTLAMTGFAGMASAANIEAGALTVGVGGFFTTTLAYSSVSTGATAAGADFDGIDILTNAEIHFKPSLTLDNGITIGAQIELEGNTSGDQIDETYFYAKGDFGQVIIGSENSAGYKMTVAAPDVSSIFAQSSSLTSFVPYSGATTGAGLFRGTLGTTYIENALNNDAQRITYFSPRFSGLQLGISYARDAGQGSGPINNNATLTDIVDIGANYSGSFGGVDINASARYGTASAAAGVANDPEIWGGGLNLGYAGWTVGGSYAEQDGTPLADGAAGDFGIGYSNGPSSYSLTYFKGSNIDNEGVIPGGRETLETLILATKYKVADNFSVGAFIARTEFEEAGAGADNVEGTVVGVSASFSF